MPCSQVAGWPQETAKLVIWGFFGHSLILATTLHLAKKQSSVRGSPLGDPGIGRILRSWGGEIASALVLEIDLEWTGHRRREAGRGESLAGPGAGAGLRAAGSDGPSSSVASLAEAHDALHHFSCKMLTPRHCAGNCSFKPPLLPQ